MVTTSWCLTEILKSWKPHSSNSEASQTADSTRASGVADPYFLSSRGSREPALTPMRRDVPWSAAALQMSATLSSNLRMLPGLTRTAPHPASMAAKTYLGWKWMSAMTGIRDCFAMTGRAEASLSVGQATRTMSQPAAVSSAICWSVAPMSWVFVVVMDCTEIGASPPTATSPTVIWRVFLRADSTLSSGRRPGMPSETLTHQVFHFPPSCEGPDRVAFPAPAASPSARPSLGLVRLSAACAASAGRPNGVPGGRGLRAPRRRWGRRICGSAEPRPLFEVKRAFAAMIISTKAAIAAATTRNPPALKQTTASEIDPSSDRPRRWSIEA